MRAKYIEELFPPYFRFGESNGRVDIASSKNDCIASVSEEDAQNILKDRDELLNMLTKVALRFDEVAHDEFTKLWYGKE